MTTLLEQHLPTPPLASRGVLRDTPWGAILAAQDDRGRDVELHAVAGARTDLLEELRRLPRHGDLVGVVDVQPSSGGTTWVVRPRVHGPTARPLLAVDARSLDREGVLEALALAARAVGHAHRHGVGDGQLEPDGLLVERGQPPRVVLGLSGAWTICGPGGVMDLCGPGYLQYLPPTISPQRIQSGRPSSGAAAIQDDVWALGVILYQALAGRPPFPGAYVARILGAILRGGPPAPSRFAPDVLPDLDALVLRALAVDPARRPRDADAFADALVDALMSGRAIAR